MNEHKPSDGHASSHDRPTKDSALDIHVVDDGYVVYHQPQNRVHYLNATAALVLELCDGTRTETELAGTAAEWFQGLGSAEVAACLGQLRAEQLVR